MDNLKTAITKLLKTYSAEEIIQEVQKQNRTNSKSKITAESRGINRAVPGMEIDNDNLKKILEALREKSVDEAVLQKIQKRNFTFDVQSTRCSKCKKCTNGGSCSYFQRVRVPKHSTAYTIPKSIKIETTKQT